MVRGSTPIHVIRVRDTEGKYTDFTGSQTVSVTYKQDDLMEITKTLETGVEIGEDGHLIVNLSKEDTMGLFPGVCKVQVEADFGGNIIISDCGKLKVENRLKSGE